MHVITRKLLLEFSEEHSEAYDPLDRWYRVVKRYEFNSFGDLLKVFPNANQWAG